MTPEDRSALVARLTEYVEHSTVVVRPGESGRQAMRRLFTDAIAALTTQAQALTALREERDRLQNKLNADSQNFELECRKAQLTAKDAEIKALRAIAEEVAAEKTCYEEPERCVPDSGPYCHHHLDAYMREELIAKARAALTAQREAQ